MVILTKTLNIFIMMNQRMIIDDDSLIKTEIFCLNFFFHLSLYVLLICQKI